MKILLRLGLLGVVLAVGGEAAIRWGIAAGSPTFKNADLYADWSTDEDYWKLRHLWGRPVAGNLGVRHDPLLGWVTPRKHDVAGVASPLLLLGDNFWESVGAQWPRESADRPLMLGELGYGYDQTLLRFQQAAYQYPHATALVGLFTAGVDRNLLSFRTGPKPYFSFTEDKLVLRGTPVEKDVEVHLADHPPQARSFLISALTRRWQLWKYKTELAVENRREEKEQLSRALLDQFITEAKDRSVRLAFVLFYYPEELAETGWREKFLKAYLEERGVPFFDTKELLVKMAKADEHSPRLFYSRTGHLNEEGSQIVAKALDERLASGRWARIPSVPLN